MLPSEVDLRIRYFHDATDEYLVTMGVDRALLPSPEVWRGAYEADFARPLRERPLYAVLWLIDETAVGFSTADHIVYGHEAFMHLHVVDAALRGQGLGTEFVRLTAAHYFEVLELKRLYSEPNAFNTAPHRALQRVGFRFLFSHRATPGPINFPQTTTRWVLER